MKSEDVDDKTAVINVRDSRVASKTRGELKAEEVCASVVFACIIPLSRHPDRLSG